MTSLTCWQPLNAFLIATFQCFKNQAEKVLELTYYANIAEMIEKFRDFA